MMLSATVPSFITKGVVGDKLLYPVKGIVNELKIEFTFALSDDTEVASVVKVLV